MLSGITSFFPDVGFLSLQSGRCEHEGLPGLCEFWGRVQLAAPQCFFFVEPYGFALCNFQPETHEDP